MEDRAGRKSSFEREFSVNRYGSTYDTRAIQKKLNTYMQEGIIVTVKEYNPDELEPTITIFENNISTMLGDDDYASDSSVTNEGWHDYTYTIGKDNFNDNARYTVKLASNDKAGNSNTNENKYNQNKAEINFAIDKNAPKGSVLNLQDNGVYETNDEYKIYLAFRCLVWVKYFKS